jgi:SSS family solute:Na+ symporter
MAAIVLGGASTIGGVGLGYQYGIAGMWLVMAIGVGILLLSLLFAGRIQRLRVYTVSQMLELRYGPGSSVPSGVVMWGYTLMLSVTSTIAYSTIFGALFDIGRVPAIILGGDVVIIYSVLGGMWSITLTDFVQFLVKTIASSSSCCRSRCTKPVASAAWPTSCPLTLPRSPRSAATEF